MVPALFSRRVKSQIEDIERNINEAFAQVSGQLSAAIDALAHSVEPDVEPPMPDPDGSIRHLVGDIRRRLIVHAAVRGHEADVPSLLVYMSITKDIDQIADLVRDLWNLVGADFDLPDQERRQVTQSGREASDLIKDTAMALEQRDADAASALLEHAVDKIADHRARMLSPAHAHASEQVVAHVVFHRSVADILARLANVLTSLELPVDRLDHWNRSGWDPAQPRQ